MWLLGLDGGRDVVSMTESPLSAQGPTAAQSSQPGRDPTAKDGLRSVLRAIHGFNQPAMLG
jgi:hypothetical protein